MSTKSDKYVGRRVNENGTTRFGVVDHAWQQPEGVVGLHIVTDWDHGFDTVTSDSEHWTIEPDRRSEQEKLNAGVAVVSARLGRLMSF